MESFTLHFFVMKEVFMNNLIVKDDVEVENMIYEIRGKYVMLDSDLAKLYECKNGTKTINLAVKRHINRFPNRFMFQLTKEEYYKILRFQSETLELEQGKYSKYLPYVFTEQGAAMLATILRTDVAEEVSIKIMDAFVSMHKYISSSLLEQRYVNELVFKDHEKINMLESSFKKLEEKKKSNEIYFDGQIYDAYSMILDIFSKAKYELIIIDSYADKTILDIVRRLNVDVTLITKDNSLLSNTDIERYSKQYNNLKVIYNSTFHDRYFILDKEKVYHCGTSINRIGYKTFSITLVNDKEVCELLINKIKKM